MVCQPMRIQVKKDFAQNADARSVAQSDRVKPALLILGDSVGGAPCGTQSGRTGKCKDSYKKPVSSDTQIAHQPITFAPVNGMPCVTPIRSGFSSLRHNHVVLDILATWDRHTEMPFAGL